MRKRITAVLLCLLLCVSCTDSASACLIPYATVSVKPVGTSVEIVKETEDSVTIRKADDAPFKILMFTDLHLAFFDKNATLKDQSRTIREMVCNIRVEQPDLVLLGGDNVTSTFTWGRTHQLARVFEKLGVYWGGVLGNHEGGPALSLRRDKMVKIFSSYDHCLMRQGKADVEGVCNYSIRILGADGALKQAVICLDSFDEMPEDVQKEHGVYTGHTVYDVIKQSQIDWYNAQIADLKQTYGSRCPSFVLLHIPLWEYAQAAKQVEEGTLRFLWGDKREGVCSAGYDSGLFGAIKASGSTTTVFCGHDHVNNFGVLYEGITLSYIEPSGYGAYGMARKFNAPESEWLEGYTRLTIADDGNITHTQVRNAAR